jgi:very-short-patch-repair endonuclease
MNEREIVKLYEKEKLSTYEIAKKFSTYPNKIRRVLIKHGVNMKTKSEAQKNALEKGASKIPTLGKKRTKEEKIKISQSLKNRWENISDKDYEQHINKCRERWMNLSEEEKKAMNDTAIAAIRRAGKEGSKLEKFLKKELTKEGFSVEAHKKDLFATTTLEIDMYIVGLKTIIEIDGPSHFLPIWGEDKLQKQIKADQQKTGLILGRGFAIIRVKHLKDSLALVDRENLKNKLIDRLYEIKDKFPPKSQRYLEIEA